MPPIKLANLPGYISALTNKQASRDWCFLECLANDPKYAKPDSEKDFILWEAQGSSIEISFVPNIQRDHPWIWSTFIIDAGAKKVRFPFNTFDVSDLGINLTWMSVAELQNEGRTKFLAPGVDGALYRIPRWSTASRSCLAFIPKNLAPFEVAADACTFQQQRLRDNTDDDPFSRSEVGQEEWAARDNRRFFTTLGKNLGAFCSTRGGSERWPDPVKTQEGRLYSVKTGVTHVGSKQQIFAGKQYLESNSTMAMLRSRVVREIEATRKHKHRDPTCLTQVEILTVTAECKTEKMIANRGWTHQAVLEFTQGLFDGFRDYCIEAFADSSTPFAMRAATHRAMSDRDILALGTKMAYPTKPFYNQQDAERVMNKLPAAAACSSCEKSQQSALGDPGRQIEGHPNNSERRRSTPLRRTRDVRTKLYPGQARQNH